MAGWANENVLSGLYDIRTVHENNIQDSLILSSEILDHLLYF